MKNTMKKLLSLVLVAMLLVCAVPFQAAATEADETLTVKTYVDGKYVTDKYVTVKPGQKLELTKELAETLIYGDKEFVKWTNMKDEETTGPISYDNLKKANANGYYVNLYLNKKVEDTRVDAKVPVEIYVDGSYARKGEITVPVDGSVKLTKELGLSLVNSDKEFVKWTGASGDEATDVTIKYDKITDGYFLKLFVNTKKAEEPVKYITLKIIDDKGNAIAREFQVEPVNGKSSVIDDILSYRWMGNWKDSYEFVTAKSDEKGNNLSLSTTINAGDSLTVTLKAKSGSTPEGDTVRVTFYGTDGKAVSTYNVTSGSSIDSKKVSDAQSKADNKTGYTFKGWKIDNKGDLYTSAQVAKLVIKGNVEFYAYLEKDTTTTNNKFPYKVYLHIFKDNKVDDPAKTINITEGIALDGKVTLDEVKTVVKNYYTAKTSDGIKYDGMYMAKGNWVGNFVNDTQKYDTISDTNELRKESEVHINVMITNANAKSATNEEADKTNPKTGDMIFIPVIFMVVSGAAIAGVYFYNKIIRQNLVWAVIYNIICIPIAAAGIVNPSIAAAAMSLSSNGVLLNSLRLKNIEK